MLNQTEIISQKSVPPARPPGLARGFTRQKTQAIDLAQLSTGIRHSAARDLHDILARGFTGVIAQLWVAEQALSRNLAAEAARRINRACKLAQGSLRQARRSIGALRSRVREEKNLCKALDESFKKMTGGTKLQAEFVFSGFMRRLAPEYEENLLHIGQEALTNTLRHARASEFKAELFFVEKEVGLLLRDNGCGFEPAERSEGFGLKGMRERVENMGGRFSVNSAKGSGTAIFIRLPSVSG